jgi:hypothetical protein
MTYPRHVWLAILVAASPVHGESPLQPIKDLSAIPTDLRSAKMVAVLHQWSPFDAEWTTVSHATFPVWKTGIVDGDSRLVVFDPKTKRVSAAQVGVVAWDGAMAPEVVQAIFSDVLEPGANVRCVFLKAGKPTTEHGASNWTLVGDHHAVAVRLTDGLGNKYRATLFERRLASLQSGPVQFTEEYFSVLRPEDPASAPAKQLFRFHTFVTARRGEPWFDVRVIIENCPSENPAGEFPFVALEFGVQDRRLVWEDPLLPVPRSTANTDGWTWHGVIPALADGKLHLAFDHFLLRQRFALSAQNQNPAEPLRMRHEPLYTVVPGLDPSGYPTASWHSTLAFGPTRVGIARSEGRHVVIRDRVDREAEAWRTDNPLLKKRRSAVWRGDRVHLPLGGEVRSIGRCGVRMARPQRRVRRQPRSTALRLLERRWNRLDA